MDFSEITGMEYFKITGQSCPPARAVKFMADLLDKLPDAVKTPEFCQEYERAMNSIRICAAKQIKIPPRVNPPQKAWHHADYVCKSCGRHLNEISEDYCPRCGQHISDAYLGRRATLEEQIEYQEPDLAAATVEVDRAGGWRNMEEASKE